MRNPSVYPLIRIPPDLLCKTCFLACLQFFACLFLHSLCTCAIIQTKKKGLRDGSLERRARQLKRANRKTACFQKALAWAVLALFVLIFIVSFSHIGCCHSHDTMDDVCPFCEACIQYTRLLRLAGLIGTAYFLVDSLNTADAGEMSWRQKFSPKATLVSLCVKLSN